MPYQVLTLNEAQNVTLTCYLYEKSPEYPDLDLRPAVLVLPGGGYAMCSDREAEPVALGFAAEGFHAFVLRYTLKSVKPWPAPLEDYEKAMDCILAHAEEWGVDKERIAVAGFSAGGHLAACAATIAKHKPRAAIIAYGALTKETVALCGKDIPLPVDLIDENTAPCFVFGTRTDNVAPVANSLAFTQKLNECGISFESHIYSYGPHGFGTGTAAYNQPPITRRAARWLKDSAEWLGEVWGERTFEGYLEPKFGRRITGDLDEHLSLSCTYPHLLKQKGEAADVLQPVFARVDAVLKPRLTEGVLKVVGAWTMFDLLPLAGFTQEELTAIDGRLKTIKNER